jgi:hypothetical protein
MAFTLAARIALNQGCTNFFLPWAALAFQNLQRAAGMDKMRRKGRRRGFTYKTFFPVRIAQFFLLHIILL